MPHLALLVRLLQVASKDRTQLVLENIGLRHQLAVYKRSITRARPSRPRCSLGFTIGTRGLHGEAPRR